MSVIYLVRWDNYDKDTYMYGTDLLATPSHCMRFRNLRMPSGTVIRFWESRKDYQRDRLEPQLPMLREGCRYSIRAFYSVQPEGSVLMRIDYYSRSGELLDYVILEGREGEIVPPEGTNSWKLSLIAAGMEELLFHHIEIIPTVTGEDSMGDAGLCGRSLEKPAAGETSAPRAASRDLTPVSKPDREVSVPWASQPVGLNILLLREPSRTIHIPGKRVTGRIPGLLMLSASEAEWDLLTERNLIREFQNRHRLPERIYPVRINFIGYDSHTDEIANRLCASMQGTPYYNLCHVVEGDRLVEEPRDVNFAATVLADRTWILENLPKILDNVL